MTKLKISDKGYTSIPKLYQEIDINTYVLDPDWYSKFVLFCQPTTKFEFDRHVGQESTYDLKPMLTNSLKFHYAVISGALENVDPCFKLNSDQKTALITKINEEIAACTPGFHARVDSLLEGYFLPKTVEELLRSIRYNIVERAANKATNEVHANNRYFIVAERMNLGVQPKLHGDPYVGAIPDAVIERDLNKLFSEQYQPFATLLSLKEMLASSFDQYSGRKEEGYPAQTYETGLNYLRNLFKETEINYDYLVTHEETGAVCDINWNLVLAKLWAILIKERYFSYSSWSSFFSNYGFEMFSRWTRTPFETICHEAMIVVNRLFLDPATITREELNKIPNLFASPTECFAYLRCNNDLSINAKITLLFSTLDMTYAKNKDADDFEFWQFAYENKDLLEDFGRTYPLKYPEKQREFQDYLLDDDHSFHDLVDNASWQKLITLSLKLKYLSPKQIGQILLYKNYNNENGLFYALLSSSKHPEAMLSFMQLIPHIDSNSLSILLTDKNLDGANILSIVLSKTSKVHIEVARELLLTIATLSELDQQTIFQLNTYPNQYCPLILAIKNYPSIVPSILNILLTLDYENQNRIINFCLASNVINNKKSLCFKRLLELGKKVNSLAYQPLKAEAYQTAKELQSTLIYALNEYYNNIESPAALTTLKGKWHDAIQTASDILVKLTDWETFLLNLALVIISIPLLGVPLVINYYQSDYKSIFFKSGEMKELKNLESLIKNDEEPLLN